MVFSCCRALTKGTEDSIDYGDTFLDAQHVIESFPNSKVVFTADNTDGLPPPPYRITVTRGASEATEEATSTSKKDGKKRSKATAAASTSETEVVTAHPYARSSRGPYPEDAVLLNSVRFTPTQIEAIRSGTNPGLTMVVGPPGTGKTDVAVQIIVNLYRNHPTQKILIVTHSNAALNDLFEKIMERDVAPRHLLRLGSGEQELRDTLAVGGAGGGGKGQGEVFSKQGRVNWSLARRLQLLAQVQKLSVSIGVPGDMGNTCETAAYFQLEHVQARIEKFNLSIASASHRPATVEEVFPFKQYFADAPAALFTGDWDTDLESARGCFTHINKIFEELADYRAFELLRSQTLRSDFLLTKQVRNPFRISARPVAVCPGCLNVIRVEGGCDDDTFISDTSCLTRRAIKCGVAPMNATLSQRQLPPTPFEPVSAVPYPPVSVFTNFVLHGVNLNRRGLWR